MPNTTCCSVVAAGAAAAEAGRCSSAVAAAVRLADARETETEEAMPEESGGQVQITEEHAAPGQASPETAGGGPSKFGTSATRWSCSPLGHGPFAALLAPGEMPIACRPLRSRPGNLLPSGG
ncbi:hypothetical protein C2845_PM16G17480 [Panicum miliaceum]|uniref:Uncharacterized protein n=1 Tax=Panicum miliaceum TaxID=4540 RepID=A0A3L6PVI0_PANMI|nr:hypothetical protein C2845_PM16G17480 [Panicum miliaceum]